MIGFTSQKKKPYQSLVSHRELIETSDAFFVFFPLGLLLTFSSVCIFWYEARCDHTLQPFFQASQVPLPTGRLSQKTHRSLIIFEISCQMWVKLANKFRNFEKVEQRVELHGLMGQALSIRKAHCKEVFVRGFCMWYKNAERQRFLIS